jgi:gliding motility-associated-like protein
MPKLYSLTLAALLLSQLHVHAQYADGGTGPLKNHIYWCNWAGFSLTEGATKTFTTSDNLTVTATFSDVSGATPIPNYMSYAGYDFSNQSIKTSFNTTGTAHYKLALTATRDGAPAPVTIAVTAADGTSFTTTGTPWNILSGTATCGTATTTISGAANVLTSTTDGIEVNMQNGSTAIFGILAAFDRGDLPASFGTAAHELNYTVSSGCMLTPQHQFFLGNIPPDADSLKVTDDREDEDAITSFPAYTGDGTYTLTIPVNVSGEAYLSAWFDFNRSGTFEANEWVTATIPAGSTSANITWTNIPARLPAGKVSQCAFRFRLSGTSLASPTGYAPDGEVEDYFIALTAPCDVKVTTLPDVILCTGQSAQLSATGATQYKWSPSMGLNADGIAQPIAAPVVPTKYTVNGTDAYGCTGSASLTVNVNPTPVITTSRDTLMCTGTTIELSGVADIPASYTWSPARGLNNAYITNPSASPDTTTNYVVTASTIYGCRTSKTIHITVEKTPEFKTVPDIPAVCIGQSVIVKADGGDEFSWLTMSDSVLTKNATIELAPIHDTTFKVYIADYTCRISDTILVPVIVYDTPVTSITKSGDIDCANASITLQAAGGIYYTWQIAPGIKNTATATPVVSPLETTTYEVTVIDKHGCTNVETITVNVDVALAFTRYPIPSAFSPNGDGLNDCFGLKRWGETSFFEFDVFNRSGSMVFSTHSPTDCWDGTFRGEKLPMGDYVYMIHARTICGDVVRKGTIMLIR